MNMRKLTLTATIAAFAAMGGLVENAAHALSWGWQLPWYSNSFTDSGSGGNFVTMQLAVVPWGASADATANVGAFDNVVFADCTHVGIKIDSALNATSWIDGNVAALCPWGTSAVRGQGTFNSH